jgi:glycosyltransferase involved in cell wall biosynthesis
MTQSTINPKYMARPTILIVTTSYPIIDNGSEAAGSFVSDLASELSIRYNIRVVAPGINNSIEQSSDGILIYRYLSPNSALSNLKPWMPIDALNIIRILIRGHKAASRAMSDGNVTHIIALWALPSGFWARTQAKKYNIDYSVWTLGSDIWLLSKIPLVKNALAKILKDAKYRFSDGIQLAKDTSYIAKKEATFLPSTRKVSIEKFSPANTMPPFKLIFIGRWHINKGVDLLLDSLEFLNNEDWALIKSIDIYGGGPLEDRIKFSVSTLVKKGRPITIYGFINKEEAENKIIGSDYVLIPSRIESIPLIFSDAIKLGKPVISTPVGDLPLLIKKGVGITSSAVNAKSYAEAIRTGLHHPQIEPTAISLSAKQFDLAEISSVIGSKLFPNERERK